jgi:wyosine [tRNA(Phe)-imidazoG37] synthetase (radical SAM superfamily)
MTTADEKPTEEEIKELEAQIKHDQEQPVRENERRVRVGANFKEAVKEMAQAPPMTNDEVAEWVKDQRKEIEGLESDK